MLELHVSAVAATSWCAPAGADDTSASNISTAACYATQEGQEVFVLYARGQQLEVALTQPAVRNMVKEHAANASLHPGLRLASLQQPASLQYSIGGRAKTSGNSSHGCAPHLLC